MRFFCRYFCSAVCVVVPVTTATDLPARLASESTPELASVSSPPPVTKVIRVKSTFSARERVIVVAPHSISARLLMIASIRSSEVKGTNVVFRSLSFSWSLTAAAIRLHNSTEYPAA